MKKKKVKKRNPVFKGMMGSGNYKQQVVPNKKKINKLKKEELQND